MDVNRGRSPRPLHETYLTTPLCTRVTTANVVILRKTISA